MVRVRLTLALLLAALAVPARGAGSSASFGVSLQVLPRVQSGLPDGKRPAFVGLAGGAALSCGVEGSAACGKAAERARSASTSVAPVVVTVLPDGSPSAIIDR